MQGPEVRKMERKYLPVICLEILIFQMAQGWMEHPQWLCWFTNHLNSISLQQALHRIMRIGLFGLMGNWRMTITIIIIIIT